MLLLLIYQPDNQRYRGAGGAPIAEPEKKDDILWIWEANRDSEE